MDAGPAPGYLPRMTRTTRDILQLLAILALTSLAAWSALGLRMQGDLSRVLKGTSEAYTTFEAFQSTFGTVGNDAILSIEAADLGRPESFAAFEDLLIELQLTPGVAGLVSVWSLPDPEGPDRPFLRRDDIAELPPAAQLDALHARVPLAADMLATDRSLTLVTVIADPATEAEDRAAALAGALATADPQLRVERVGLSQLHLGVQEALQRDQLRLTPLSMALCAALALLLFRSGRAAVICATPPVIALVWTLGLQSAAGIEVDPLVATVPTLILVLGFADAVHLHHAVGTAGRDRPLPEAIDHALREIWPALVLTSSTTALAFLSLLFVGSPTLANVALVGTVGLALVLVAVVAVMPPLTRLLMSAPPRPARLALPGVGRAAQWLLARPLPVTLAGLALFVGLLGLSTRTEPGYDMSHHIPRGSDFAQSLERVEARLPGSDRLHVVVTAADPAPGLQAADRDRLDAVGQVLYGAPPQIPERVDPDNPLTSRFIAADGSAFALPVAAPLDTGGNGTEAAARDLTERLDAAGLGGVTQVTGYSLMSFAEIRHLVIDLRFAFYIAVGIVALLAAVLTGSIRLALASLLPNLIPILGVEGWLVVTGTSLTMTGAIALTVAFGIAVDDTIHMLNRLRLERRTRPPREAISAALTVVAPPVVMTSLILVLGFSVSALSLLPSIVIFAKLTASAVALACIANLFLFPGLLVWASPKETRPWSAPSPSP